MEDSQERFRIGQQLRDLADSLRTSETSEREERAAALRKWRGDATEAAILQQYAALNREPTRASDGTLVSPELAQQCAQAAGDIAADIERKKGEAA